jgi:hypothetical protein
MLLFKKGKLQRNGRNQRPSGLRQVSDLPEVGVYAGDEDHRVWPLFFLHSFHRCLKEEMRPTYFPTGRVKRRRQSMDL